MKNCALRYKIILLLSILLVTVVLPVFAANSQVAKVGAVVITSYELAREQQKLMPFGSFHGGVSKEKADMVRQQALDKLVERAYKVNHALKEEVSVENSLVDEKIKNIISRFGSKNEFEKALGGESQSELRASIYRQMLAEKIEKITIDDKIKIDDKEIFSYYENNKATYKRPKRFKASHIMVKVDPSSNKEQKEILEKRAFSLYERAIKGEDFYNLAYYNSDDKSKYVGGDMGYFHEGQTIKEFEKQLLMMKPGEISPPVKSMYGFHVIKLIEVEEPKLLSFEEVKEKIKESMYKRLRDDAYASWMAKLKAAYPVVNN